MKYIIKKNKIILFLWLMAIVVMSACNKDLEQFTDAVPVVSTGSLLGDTLRSNPNDSLYYRLIVRSGLLSKINDRSTTYTMFVPDNNGMKFFINAISGGLVPLNAPDAVFSGFITNNIPVASAQGLVSYNISPQALLFSSIPAVFPNFQYPTTLNPAPTLSALLRLSIFPSSVNGRWVNNIPVVAADLRAGNGIIHHTGTIVPPPQRYLWDRINTDADLTILKAAIQRADSGVIPNPPSLKPNTLQLALQSIGTNLTVLAPENQAFKNVISFLTGGAIPPTAPDVNFIAFLGSNNISTRKVKGIIVYHLFDDQSNTLNPAAPVKRPGGFFSVNLPVTPTIYPSALSSADSIGITYPKLTFLATFTGPRVSAATVKGNANATASNFLINPTPDPNGTSDQHYVNGVLHKIDQVLLPQ